MKITLDSTEPLDDAIRVVGAMYGVTLRVSDPAEGAIKPVEKKKASRRARKAVTPQKRPPAGGNARPGAATAAARTGRSTSERARRSNGSPTNADVRSWARENGLKVSDRGRMPGSVMAAYLNAHTT